MISYIEGRVLKVEDDSLVVLTAAGIGFKIYVTSKVLGQYNVTGAEISLNTYMSVREDGMFLYGFLTAAELEMFKKLITVTGVGPKAALAILSVLDITDIVYAIYSGDTKAFQLAQGVGKKMAEKIIIFLKDSVGEFETKETGFITTSVDNIDFGSISDKNANEIKTDAINALCTLGYSYAEAMKTVKSIEINDGTTAEDVIKQALKKM